MQAGPPLRKHIIQNREVGIRRLHAGEAVTRINAARAGGAKNPPGGDFSGGVFHAFKSDPCATGELQFGAGGHLVFAAREFVAFGKGDPERALKMSRA